MLSWRREWLINELVGVLEAGFAAAYRQANLRAAETLSALLSEAENRLDEEQFLDPAPIYTTSSPFVQRIDAALRPISADPQFVAEISELGVDIPAAKTGHPWLLVVGLSALGLAGVIAFVGRRRP